MQRLLAVTLLAAACGTSTTTPGQPGGPGEPGQGTQQDPVPQPAEAGPYLMTTKIDLTVEAILPAQAEDVVVVLREFSMNPAHAIIDAATLAGVPAIGAIYNALPDFITSKLEGWINGEIEKIQIAGKPITEWAGDIAALADTALSQFAVDSTLAVEGTTSTHTLTDIDFSPAGIDFKLPLDALPAELRTQQPTITVGAAGALAIGEQHFGLNYGDYAWTALNGEVATLFGGDLRTTLGHAIDCAAIAHTVASKCVLGVCVGHESDLDSMCTGGLDGLVNILHDQFTMLDQDALELATGTATLVDDDGDGVADRITSGTWDAQMNLGMGLRHTPATFTATRSSGAGTQ